MQEHLKDFGKYTASAALNLLLVIVLGSVTTLTVTLAGFFTILFKNSIGGAAHAGGSAVFFMVALLNPVSTVIWFIAGIILPVVYFALGYKFALKKLIHKVLHNKGEIVIYPLLEKLLNEFRQRQPATVKNSTDYGLKKLQLIESIKHGNSNSLVKRIVIFGLNKVKLNDVELNKEGQDFYDVIKIATVQQLQQVSKPSWWPLLIIMAFQWLGLWLIKTLPI